MPEPAGVAEAAHPPGDHPLWSESWYFDFAARDGSLGGYVRLGLLPAQKVAWYWAYLVGDGRPLIAVRDHEVDLPRSPSLEIRTSGLWSALHCETPHEHWSIGLEAFGVAMDDPAEAYRAERGDRVALGLDLEWEAGSPVYDYPGVTRYEQACRVHGEVLVGDERIDFDGTGERDHSWGVRDWWAFPWMWTSAWFGDGMAIHGVRIGTEERAGYMTGFVASSVEELKPVANVELSTDLGAEGLPKAARMQFDGLHVDVEPLHHAPVSLVAPDGRTGRFPRSLCRHTDQADTSRVAYGWTEWNQPQA